MYLQDMDEVSNSIIEDIGEVLEDLETVYPDLIREEDYRGENISTGDIMMYAKAKHGYNSEDSISNTGVVNKTLGIMCYNDILEPESERVPSFRTSHMEVSPSQYNAEKHEKLTEYIQKRINEFTSENENLNLKIDISGFENYYG